MNLEINLERIEILTTLSLASYKHSKSIHLGFLISHGNISSAQGRDFMYFMFWDATANDIVLFFIQISICLSLVYRHATDFCKLILYPEILLKILLVLAGFFVD